jgi:hypothetical protein
MIAPTRRTVSIGDIQVPSGTQLRKLEGAWNAASDAVRVTFGFEVLGLGQRAYSLPKKAKDIAA